MNRLGVLVDGLLDLIYPPRCLICDAWDSPVICSECTAGFLPIPTPSCVACGRPVEPETICRSCELAADLWGGWAFERARAIAIFQGPVRHGIHQLKYFGKEAIGEALGAFLADSLLTQNFFDDVVFDALVPVPITETKRKKRGFNQAELLARAVSDALNTPLLPSEVVARSGQVAAQATLSPEARRRNVGIDSFLVTQENAVVGKRLLIVDDVFTTGSTVHALAATLRRAGASAVDVVTLAAGG